MASPKGGKPVADAGPPPWTIMGGQSKVAWDPTMTWTGERSVKLTAATRTPDPKAWTGFYQKLSVPVVAGAEYRVSLRALTEKSADGNGVWPIFWGADGKPVREVSTFFAPDLPIWTMTELKLEAPAGADKVEVSFHHDSPGGTVWIDAISLTCQGEEILANGDLEPKQADAPRNISRQLRLLRWSRPPSLPPFSTSHADSRRVFMNAEVGLERRSVRLRSTPGGGAPLATDVGQIVTPVLLRITTRNFTRAPTAPGSCSRRRRPACSR